MLQPCGAGTETGAFSFWKEVGLIHGTERRSVCIGIQSLGGVRRFQYKASADPISGGTKGQAGAVDLESGLLPACNLHPKHRLHRFWRKSGLDLLHLCGEQKLLAGVVRLQRADAQLACP